MYTSAIRNTILYDIGTIQSQNERVSISMPKISKQFSKSPSHKNPDIAIIGDFVIVVNEGKHNTLLYVFIIICIYF